MNANLRKRLALLEREMERRRERSPPMSAPPVILQFVTVDPSGQRQQNVKCWFDGRGLVGP
jgi:hypothetical protein